MIVKKEFGTTADGRKVDLFTLSNSGGMRVDLITYGAAINSIYTADRNGEFADVLKGFDTIEGHEKYSNYQGLTVGRYANRIANGRFELDGTAYDLVKNEKGITCLHGGGELSHAVWKALITDDNSIEMTYSSPDGAEGFPGNVDFKVTFILHEDNSLEVKYSAVSDKKTVINMTNHSYFNLNGDPNVNIENHLLQLNAYIYTPSDATYMTTGDTVWVKGTPMDFLELTEVGKNVNNFDYKPIKNANGFDHNWCLASYANGKGNDKLVSCTLYSPVTGIKMDVYTNEPGVQVYTGNFLDGSLTGKKGITYQKRAGICLETQKYPDSPNKKGWPSAYLSPGEKYYSHCIYKFSVAK